jgi:hypothetical protein
MGFLVDELTLRQFFLRVHQALGRPCIPEKVGVNKKIGLPVKNDEVGKG